MPGVGFEPTIRVFKRAKTVPALDGAAAVIGCHKDSIYKNLNKNEKKEERDHCKKVT
jgi:hypothetical protein